MIKMKRRRPPTEVASFHLSPPPLLPQKFPNKIPPKNLQNSPNTIIFAPKNLKIPTTMAKRKSGIPEIFLTEKQKEFRRINSQKPARSRTMAAAKAHIGEGWVRDPMLLL